MKKNIIKRTTNFFEKDIWHIQVKDKHPLFSFLIKQGRILFIAAKGFTEDKIQLRASALSFYTMLSMVPLLSLVFVVALAFGLSDRLTEILNEQFADQKEVLNMLLGFVDKYLDRINTGYIAGIGVIILLWSVMKVLGNIESSFNNIWEIKKSRMLTRKFSDYISILIIAPVFLIIASSFNVSKLEQISGNIDFFDYLGNFLKLLMTFLSYTLIWFVFTLIYIVIPNTKVRFLPALIAGIIAGTMFQLLQWGYVKFQSLLAGYETVYGTLAFLPLLMIWLELSWLIVLLGAEISFAYQNAEHYEQEAESENIALKDRKLLALMVIQKIIRNFGEGNQPLKSAEIASQLGIPVRKVRETIYDLLNAQIINETLTREVKEVAYQPALDPAKITISYLLEAIDNYGQKVTYDEETPELKKLSTVLESFYADVKNSPKNKPIKDLI